MNTLFNLAVLFSITKKVKIDDQSSPRKVPLQAFPSWSPSRKKQKPRAISSLHQGHLSLMGLRLGATLPLKVIYVSHRQCHMRVALRKSPPHVRQDKLIHSIWPSRPQPIFKVQTAFSHNTKVHLKPRRDRYHCKPGPPYNTLTMC